MTEITWFGHSAFRVATNNVVILVDPFLDGCPTCPIESHDVGHVDLVLVTHDHADHVGQAVEICQKTKAMLVAVVGTAEKLMAAGIPPDQIVNGIGHNMGGTVAHKGVQATIVPAFHTSDSGQAVGYIITMPDGTTVYHSGDTCIFGDMALWGTLYNIDVALLPIGGVFTMDTAQAAMACQMLRAKKAIPMHWGTFPVLEKNVTQFKGKLAQQAPDCLCVDMRPGQTIMA